MAKPITNIKLKRPGTTKGEHPNLGDRVVRKITGVDHLVNNVSEWWLQPEDKIAGVIAQLITRMDQNNVDYRQQHMRYARMYGNYEALGVSNLNYSNISQQTNNLPIYNIIQSCVDVVNSKICRDNPEPYFITSGADYFDKLKAEKMTQFVQGLFQEMNLYDLANNKVFRDAAVYGLGALQFIHNKIKNKIECEWVFIDELKFDMYDAQKDKPRSLHRCKMVQREMLIAQFPDKKDVIDSLTTAHPGIFKSQDTVIDFVVYTESFHLANGDHKGRHVISLLDKVLLDEEYDEDWFPFAFFPYYEKPAGLWGRGIAESIMSGQIEINKILFFIQQCQELQATPLIVVDNDSQISPASLMQNRVARLLKIRSGTMVPQFISPQSTGAEIYQHLKDWMAWCREEVGVSQTSVSGEKQAGINSAVALRTMVDIESSRFIQVSKNWEKFFVNCAEICVKMGKKIYEKDTSFSVQYTDKKSSVIREIPWKKINLPNDTYVIKCDTVSSFPQSAAGRIQTITDYIANNFISKERGMELLNLDPDLEDEVKLQTATLRLVEKRLSEMVEEQIYMHPEPYMDLQYALKVSTATYNQLCIDNCPEDRLELVRQWIKEIVVKITGNDPNIALLQQAFAPPVANAPVAPQAGLQPNQPMTQ